MKEECMCKRCIDIRQRKEVEEMEDEY